MRLVHVRGQKKNYDEPFMINKKLYKVFDIFLTKINALINYGLLNGAVA